MKIELRVERREWSFLSFKPTFFGILTAIALALSAGPGTQAQTIIGPTVYLSSLTNGSGGIQVGDKFFSHFSVPEFSGFVGGLAISNITVTGIQDGFGYGIQFGGGFAAGGSVADLDLDYNVGVTNSPMLISAANLYFNGVVIPNTADAFASVTETVYTNGFSAGTMDVYVSGTSTQMEDSLAISPPQPMLMLSKDVELYAQLSSFSVVSSINQTFTQVTIPEPSTVALAIMGIAGALLAGRRKHSSRL